MKRIITLVTVLAVGFLGLAGPAEAGTYRDSSLTLTTSDLAVWATNCGNVRYSVTGPFKNAVKWDVFLTLEDPYGEEVGVDYFASGDSVTSGASFLCDGWDVSGRYSVTAEYETYDADDNVIEHETVYGGFSFTRRAKQASSMTMKKTRMGAHSWKMVGRLTKAGRAWSGHRVQIQAYVAGGWGTVKTKTTNRNGRVTFTSKPKRGAGKIPLRLHSIGGSYVRDANSRTFRVKPR